MSQQQNEKALWTPKNDVLAVIDDMDAAENAIGDLVAAGCEPEDIALYTGEAAADRFDTRGERAGWFTRIIRGMWHASTPEGGAMDDYEAQVKEGRPVLAIHVEDDTRIPTIHETLKHHNAHHMRYFSDWTIVVLPVE